MVVVLTLVHIVEHSLLMVVILLILPTGVLELLYCSSYYTRRGGASDHGNECGAFSIYAYPTESYFHYYTGAAL